MSTLSGPAALDTDALRSSIEAVAPAMGEALRVKGHYTTQSLIDTATLETMRAQAMDLHKEGRFEQSWSESIVDGKATRFDKPGVFACEPDGADYETAPDLISYMSTLITTLPTALNPHVSDMASICNQSFNAKLAVTEAQSEYPLHVDNSLGATGGDMRKLTCILYLNPEYNAVRDEGMLRLLLLNNQVVDLEPSIGLVCFWTDEIPHKVLRTGTLGQQRYALTIWLADQDPTNIRCPTSKFSDLRVDAFHQL